MKKFILQIVVTLLIFATSSTATMAFYDDVGTEQAYYNEMRFLHDLGKLPNEPDNLFHPDDLINKAELYKLILVFAGSEAAMEISLPYTDIPADSPYAGYIQKAIDLKILKPYELNPEFNSDLSIAKNNALSTMFSALGIGTSYFFDKENFPFSDLSPEASIAAVAEKAYEIGILEIDSPENFKMAKRITKAEAAHYLYKIYKYSPDASTGATIPTISVTLNTDGHSYNETEKELIDDANFPTLLDVWSSLKNDYLYKDELKNKDLIYGAIKGMVEKVSDKYTVFQEPSAANNLISSLGGEYEGIGIVIEMIEENVTIISPFKNSPAELAGLQANDKIIKVNDEEVKGKTLDEVSTKIKGPKDSSVKITVDRDGKELSFDIIRKAISIKTAEGKVINSGSKKIGYISIINFGDSTYDEFVKTVTDLKSQSVDGFIIDLRNNPGGYLDIAVNIIGLFTDEIKTAVTLESVGGDKQEYKTNGNGLLKDYKNKIVILINEGSASASEILAGALKDYGIAKLVGEKTFGKGSVQQLRQYGDNSIFKVTISQWLTPNGTNINGNGIEPDKVVKKGTDKTKDDQLDSALGEF